MKTKLSSLLVILSFALSMNATPIYKVGVNRTDITTYLKGAGMLGYSMAFNTAEGVRTRLHARSFVIENLIGQRTVIVECELCFIPGELKTAVVERIQGLIPGKFDEENVLITAQHTHTGPAGFCHYPAYNMSVPGYIPSIFNFLADQIASGIVAAYRSVQPCVISVHKGSFGLEKEVAFNRSIKAYNQNSDVKKVHKHETHKAVNREMTLMNFTGIDGTPIGSINWFGVHATSLSNDYKYINADNKGYAATFMEEYFANLNPNYVGAFAQGTAGDVSPKFVYNKKRHWQRGKYEGKFPDDEESAKYNGRLQFDKALEIINDSMNQHRIVEPRIRTALRYYDFSNITVDRIYNYKSYPIFTTEPCMGMAMLGGALIDGPAAPKVVVAAGAGLTHLVKRADQFRSFFMRKSKRELILRKYAAQGKKAIIMENDSKRLLGTKDVKNLFIPGFLDPTIATFKKYHRLGALEEHSWSPKILPIQLIEIGDVVLAALPFEITTTAGNRLLRGIKDLYANEGIKEIILCPYSNAYSGYITTYEEYQEQFYEGGHTVFGQHSLAALQTVFKQLFEVRNTPLYSVTADLCPPEFSEEELNKRLYYDRKAKRD
ncbi:MAG: hypothetical protein RL264_2514 [Bacteroidota bacterium]|jgi:neutral ceramidase